MEPTGIDLLPLTSALVEILAGLVLALGAFAIKKLITKLGLETDDKIRGYFEIALQNAVEFGKLKVKTEISEFDKFDVSNVQIKNDVLRHATSYVLTKVPDAVDKFKLTEQDVKDLLTARLARIGE